jgi:hypothetical protein
MFSELFLPAFASLLREALLGERTKLIRLNFFIGRSFSFELETAGGSTFHITITLPAIENST